MKKNRLNRAAVLVVLGAAALHAQAPVLTKTTLSPVYTIDRIYKSMEGPQSTQQVTLLDGPPELVWITGFRTEMVGADGLTPSLPEFMCHVNLDFDAVKHKTLLGTGTNTNSRILTLSQGQISVRFPKGFGMPVLSNEALSMTTQVLNHNLEHPGLQVRHKVNFDFIRDQDLKEPMKPLYNTNVFGMKLLEGKDGHFGMADTDDAKHGPSCLPGATAPNGVHGSVYQDSFERKFTGHWVVKPGREVNYTNVTKQLYLPYDTTLHYVVVHLHPFAESLELRDMTTGKTVFKSKTRGFKDKIGLAYVDSFSSRKGVPLFKDHEYDIVSVYNNTTSTDKDSMAVMLLFLLDKQFTKPVIKTLGPYASAANSGAVDQTWINKARETGALWHDQKILLKTTLGDLVVTLDPKAAPATVAHFTELVSAGAYDMTKILYILPGFVVQFGSVYDRTTALSESQQSLVHRLPLEPGGMKHERGVLSMARDPNDPDSAESSFCIFLGNAPHLDGHYTAFGKVEKGMDVLDAIEKAPRNDKNQPNGPLRIEKAEILGDKANLKTSSPAVSGGGRHTTGVRPSSGGSITTAMDSRQQSAGMTKERLVLHTPLGNMTFKLFSDIAPQTVEQVLRLVRAGAYDSVRIFRVEPGFVAQVSTAQDRLTPLTNEQQALLRKLPAEFSTLRHHRGILSMAREDNDVNSAESSFSILLGDAPHLDGKYTIFGKLESGSDVLSAIEKAPRHGNAPDTRVNILKAEVIGPDSAQEAPSCHPNEGGAPMPEHLPTSATDPTVVPTDKPVVSEQGVTPAGQHYKVLTFKGMKIDKLYPSMRGPWTRAYLTLAPDQPHLWITGYRAEVLDGENGKASQEFMCHTKFDQVAASYAASQRGYQSFFVISQGQDEIRFPEGFGLRVDNSSDYRYDLNVMVLNNNYPDIKRKLDFKATVTYMEDQEAKKRGVIPLTIVATTIFCPMDPKTTAPGEEICRPASPGEMQGPNGSTGHWFVPPGRHKYHQVLTLPLARDTTVHYIMAHLHPHAESVELRDLTANQSVWKGKTLNDPDPAKSLLLKTDNFSSVKGEPLYKNHKYELVAVYNNPTQKDIDAMASFWIYVRVDPV